MPFFILLILFFTSCSKRVYISHSKHIKESKSIQKATLRPYKVKGKIYRPYVVPLGTTFRGIASWYGKGFHGKRTSNGEI